MTTITPIRRLATLSLWHSQLEKLFTLFAAITAIFMTAWLTRQAGDGPALLASMGASSAILFAIHGSPLAQPWALVGGHMVSGLIGVIFAHAVDDRMLAAALTAGLSVLTMSLLRCLHPPGVATALIPILNYPKTGEPNFEFLLTPLALNVSALLLLALIINRQILRRNYPLALTMPGDTHQQPSSANQGMLVARDEIEVAVREFGQFIDVGIDDLQRLFNRLQLQHLQSRLPNQTCGDIMQRAITTLEYATEVETAWSLMHQHQLKIMPVLDRGGRVIGIVTLYDFLKNLQLTPLTDFQPNWLTFIKRTPAASTNKPESIGHIMSRKIQTMPASAPICKLIPLLIAEGHRHVPIVDHEQRFVGLIAQSDLIAALITQHAEPATETVEIENCR